MRSSRSGRGFTLIEIMVVVIIIAALASMVVPRLWPVAEDAKIRIAAADIQNITTLLELYRLRNDRFPGTEGGLNILYPEYTDRQLRDPWREDYLYQYPGTHNPNGFDLWSKGPNKQGGDGDDITNWGQS
jgi:general secretion pathway protein G